MTKKILIILLIAVIAFTQNPHRRQGRRQQGRMTGGYHKAEGSDLQLLKKAGPFVQVQQKARFFYKQKTGNTLGDIVSVDRQVVSGMNFKITFAAAPGNTQQTVIITVYFQPWTKTIQVTNVSPAIDGITDQTGRVLPNVQQN